MESDRGGSQDSKETHHFGTGGCKTSARVLSLVDGTGRVQINGRELPDYFTKRKTVGSSWDAELVEMWSKARPVRQRARGGFTGQGGVISQGLPGPQATFGGTEAAALAEAKRKPAAACQEAATSAIYSRRRMKERKKDGRKAGSKSFQFRRSILSCKFSRSKFRV